MPDTVTNDMQSVIKWVRDQTDRSVLESIIQASQQRLSELEQRYVRLAPYQDTWQAVFSDGGIDRRISLGKRLSPVEALAQYNEQPPRHEDYALPFAKGKEMLARNPKEIGWWTGEDGRTAGYFQLEPFRKAKAEWHERARYVKDPLALTYGIQWKGVRILREIEKRGYQIVFP